MGTFEPSNILRSIFLRWTSQKGPAGVARRQRFEAMEGVSSERKTSNI